MERFHGRLRDGGRIIFGRLAGYAETIEAGGTGLFEVCEGGLLGNALATDRPYHLDLEDGRLGEVRVTKVHASDSAGFARFEFLLVDGLSGRAASRQGSPVQTLA